VEKNELKCISWRGQRKRLSTRADMLHQKCFLGNSTWDLWSSRRFFFM